MTLLVEQMNLSGKRALITGAAGNLGQIMSETLSEMGADLVLVDRNRAYLEEQAKVYEEKFSNNTHVCVCDLEVQEERQRLANQVLSVDEIDILINNAAFVGTSALTGWAVSFEEQSIETWRRAVEVNLTAAFHLCQLFGASLASKSEGSIINIASIYGQYAPDWSLYEGTEMSNPAAYGVSKAGLIQLTKWLATTLSPKVRVNAISPGGIFRNQPEPFVKSYERKTPLGRMAREADFKGVTAFLASDMSSYVTGQVLNVDGGWSV